MSDSDESGVTYTDIFSPFEELSDIGSPRADDHEHFELTEMLEDPYAPPSPDYIPGLEHADDEIVAEDQPYAEDALPIAQSPEYVPVSDFEVHPEDDDDEDPEEDPVDYLVDGGDDGDNEEESSEDDEDDDMDIEADEEEEDEHPAPADSSAATPPPHPAYRMTARISIPALVPMPAWTDSEVVRLLAMSSPPASPLSPWSSPSPRIPFPPLPPILSPPSPVLSPAPPPSPIRSLGYQVAMIQLRDEAASTSSPPLQLPSASRREDRPEVTLPPQKRLGITLGSRYEVGESSSAAARPAGVETLQGALVSTDTELGGYMREFETRVRQDMDEIYMRLDDEQTERQLLAGRLNMLFRDRHASDLVHGEVMSLRTTILGQMSEIRELQATDHRRHTVISELLRTDHRRSTEITELRTALQGQVTALQGHVTALQAQVTTLQGQQGLAGGPTQPELPEEADQETINATSVTNTQLQAMIDQGVTAALAARDALRSTNGDDSHNSRIGVRRTERATRECTYTDFLKCQPLPFKSTEGVASLSQWCERMKSVFHISNCAVENQVKFATCTLHSVALTWWNTHVQTVGHEAAYGMSWKTLMKMMTEKYCPRNEIRKLEMELWDLKLPGSCLLWGSSGVSSGSVVEVVEWSKVEEGVVLRSWIVPMQWSYGPSSVFNVFRRETICFGIYIVLSDDMRFADKQSARPFGSLPSNTQPNPKGSSSKLYQPPQARNEHVNVVFTWSGKSYNPPIILNNQQNKYETPINFDRDDENDEPTPQPKNSKPVKETPTPKPYKPKVPYPQRLRKEKVEAQYGKFLDMIPFSCNALADLGTSINLMSYSLYAKLSLKTLKPTKMSVRLVDRSFQYHVGIAKNLLVEFGKFTFLADFVILKMKEDSKVPLILGRSFLHTADAVIRVKQKQLNLKVGTEQIIFHIDSAMKHPYSNDDTCFSIDVIDEILEEYFDALLNESSKILHSIKGTILEETLFAEFDEFMAMTADKNSESESDTKEPPFEKITFTTNYKIKTSYEEPPMDLELKPLPNNLEYVFLEEPAFLPVIISSHLSEEDKKKLVYVLKKHKQAFAWKTTDILGICPSFSTFQRCMLAIFHDMIKESLKVFMDDFSIFGSSFDHCLNKLEKILQRCKDAHLVLNWEKCHFMVKERIVTRHKVSEAGLEVDKTKIKTIVHIDHSALRYLFKKQDAKPCLICWILLLEEFDIEIKDRKGTDNVAADHLYRIENEEINDDSEVVDKFPRETLMEIDTKDDPWFAGFINYLVSDIIPKGMTYQQKNKFFSDLKHYFWEEPYLFKVCSDGMIRRCVSGPETHIILDQYHHGPTGGHYGLNTKAKKVLDSGFYWPTIIKEAHTQVRLCEAC
nr:reverse transcriptase domain-containing protein [Tanacetum cinerariifolium]